MKPVRRRYIWLRASEAAERGQTGGPARAAHGGLQRPGSSAWRRAISERGGELRAVPVCL